MKIKLGIIIFCLIFILGFAIFQYFSVYDGRLHVVFCDVGQGDGIYIRTPNGSDIVIDSGRDDSILSCLSNNMPFWDRTIELAFATHPDADHISGFIPILQGYKVNHYNTVESDKDNAIIQKINTLLKEQGITPRLLKAGDTFYVGDAGNRGDGVKIRTLWPSKEFLNVGDSDSNRYSLVQILTYKDFDVLLTGDIDFDILNAILKENTGNWGYTGIEVFKLPHHGSRTGLDSETLTFIKPRLGIISAGKNNSYGHPHKEVISELVTSGVKYVGTDEHGEIELVSSGQGFQVK